MTRDRRLEILNVNYPSSLPLPTTANTSFVTIQYAIKLEANEKAY